MGLNFEEEKNVWRGIFGILGEEEGERRSDGEGTNPDLEGLQAGCSDIVLWHGKPVDNAEKENFL